MNGSNESILIQAAMVSCDEIKSEWISVSNNKGAENDDSIIFTEQFVNKVQHFSSQYGSDKSISYTAYNIAGNPSKFPDYGDFPQAFVMRTYGCWWDKAPSRLVDYMPQNNDNVVCQDYIDVAYDREVYPIRVSIYETYNPGSVVGIWAADSSGKWSRLWRGLPQVVSHKPRIFSPPLQPCSFKTKMLRLEFNHSKQDYYTELDAVLLIGTSEFIQPHFRFNNKNLSTLLRQLNDSTLDCDDVYNLTPDYLQTHKDLRELKNTFYKHCQLSNRNVTGRIHKGTIIDRLGTDYHCIPPIEEAVSSLHRFLQEDFPKLMQDIDLSTSSRSAVAGNKTGSSLQSGDICGSFSVLPDEAVLKILRNLDLRSLCRCCQVNRHFNNIARDALLYTSLNLKPYWYCIDTSALETLASRCQYLQRLDLSWCGNYNTITSKDIQEFLTSSGNQLTHLRFNSCQFVNNSVILKVSMICRNLKELCLRNCVEITKDGFWPLANLQQLERLELYRTLIQTPSLCAILKGNRGMRHLNLAACDHVHNMDDIAMEVAYSCPHLESVDFWKSHSLTPHGVRALARCTMLREVDFGWCLGMGAPGESLRALAASCQNLEKVFLAALRGLTDRDLEPFLACSKLRQLDFLGARSLTPEICLRFLLYCTQLEMMDLSFCEGISDMKIHEWRQLYPHVSIKRSFQASGSVFT
ncbi:F-box/LRR-repeat protein 4 isoform X1 [Neodiprion virginianus]|uniref:F-box/LRR-repeat protein 4 isoform X1 n=2 Tax=Neodiprion virginianus TaxID=2961670 RepID=UPI001EE6B4F5|nr:F-box/LRR-repeat protein 4 isoform X1 [Neodiprion virginianus]